MRQTLRYVILNEGHDAQEATESGFTAEVELPTDAELLPGVGVTSKGIVVYAIAEREGVEDRATTVRSFFICGNGVDMPDEAGSSTFRGTFKPGPGSPTFHVYDIVQVPAAS